MYKRQFQQYIGWRSEKHRAALIAAYGEQRGNQIRCMEAYEISEYASSLSEDLKNYDREVTVFDAGAEAALGKPENDNFLAEHMQIAFGKPGGVCVPYGDLLTYFWCTRSGITHTRWVRLAWS